MIKLSNNKGNISVVGKTTSNLATVSYVESTTHWDVSGNNLQPLNNENNIKIGTLEDEYSTKMNISDQTIPYIKTTVTSTNYNPYSTSVAPTNNTYFNYVNPGSYQFFYANPNYIIMHYFLIGGGGNGQNADPNQSPPYSGGGGGGGEIVMGSIVLQNNTNISIYVGNSNENSYITIRETTINAIAGNNANGMTGGTGYSGNGGNGGNTTIVTQTDGEDTVPVTFADNFINNKILVGGGGGGGGQFIVDYGAYSGLNGGGGGGGGSGTMNDSITTSGGLGKNGVNGTSGSNDKQTHKGTDYDMKKGGNGGKGFNFMEGGVGGGGGGGGFGEEYTYVQNGEQIKIGNIGKGGKGGCGAVMLYFLNSYDTLSKVENNTLYVYGNAHISRNLIVGGSIIQGETVNIYTTSANIFYISPSDIYSGILSINCTDSLIGDDLSELNLVFPSPSELFNNQSLKVGTILSLFVNTYSDTRALNGKYIIFSAPSSHVKIFGHATVGKSSARIVKILIVNVSPENAEYHVYV